MTSGNDLTTLFTDTLHGAPIERGLALVFPGQGSQSVGMGREAARASTIAAQTFEQADAVLGRDLRRLCFQGPKEELRLTASAQPAILVTSLALLATALESRLLPRRPAFLAGHSLGEYTALVVAGSLSFDDALQLVAERGRLMEEAGVAQPGSMAALLGLSEEEAEDVCRLSACEPCNYNSPTQIVIGGEPDRVAEAAALARERGARVLPLEVSGAFHTTLLAPAAAEFARTLERFAITDASIPVLGNVTARPLRRAEEIRDELARQMVSPVRWHQSVVAMAEAGVGRLVEAGPGRVLSALVRRSGLPLTAESIDNADVVPSVSNV